jgi:hypothetical protein
MHYEDSSMTVHEVYEKYVKPMSPEEQHELVALVNETEASAPVEPRQPITWADACGIVKYPLVGEDAQTWVTRERAESDEERGL